MPLEQRDALFNSCLAAWPSGLSWGIKTWQSKGNVRQVGIKLERVSLFFSCGQGTLFEKIAFEGSFYCLLPWPCLQRRSLLFLGFLCHSLSHLLWAWEVYLFVSWYTLMHEALSKRAVLWGLIRCFLEPLLLTVGFWLSREQYISAHNVECVCTYVYMCVYLCVCVLMCACKVWVPVRMKGYFLVARKLLSVSIVHSTYF